MAQIEKVFALKRKNAKTAKETAQRCESRTQEMPWKRGIQKKPVQKRTPLESNPGHKIESWHHDHYTVAGIDPGLNKCDTKPKKNSREGRARQTVWDEALF